MILLNGGAIISLLTYIGHTNDNGAGKFSESFVWYVVGLVAIVLAYLTAYISQGAFLQITATEGYKTLGFQTQDGETGKNHAKSGNLAIAGGVLLCVISLLAFVAGSWSAMQALT